MITGTIERCSELTLSWSSRVSTPFTRDTTHNPTQMDLTSSPHLAAA